MTTNPCNCGQCAICWRRLRMRAYVFGLRGEDVKRYIENVRGRESGRPRTLSDRIICHCGECECCKARFRKRANKMGLTGQETTAYVRRECWTLMVKREAARVGWPNRSSSHPDRFITPRHVPRYGF